MVLPSPPVLFCFVPRGLFPACLVWPYVVWWELVPFCLLGLFGFIVYFLDVGSSLLPETF